MRILIVVGLIFVANFCYGQSGQIYKPDPCNIQGTVYVESNRGKADFTVFVDSNSATVDLVVFQESRNLYANRTGLWHFTDDRSIANHIIYYEKSRAAAGLIIQFTKTESFAGCNQN
jgi:hypothetical protein